WYNTFSKLFSAKFWKVIFITIVFSIAFGIIIELLQGSLTTFRTADYHDVIANSLGVMMAGILIVSTRKRQVKKL
ncbi:MAG: VanZ family protein, partial [Flavobacteriaceae bacterium]|nr:VanZ family protein [Flavobacteriaceae bacterium]